MLGGEGDEAGVPAIGGGDGAAAVIVRRHAPRRAFLRDVAMCLDPAGQDELARGVDLPLCRQAFGDGGDAPVGDADVGLEGIGRGGDGAVPDDKVHGHTDLMEPPSQRIRLPVI